MIKINSHHGFTLIELMITVAIVAVLASIALPSYQDQIRKTRRTDAMNAVLECAAQQEREYTVRNSYDTTLCAADSDDGHYDITVTVPVAAGCTTVIGAVTRNNCFTITATAKAASAQIKDTSCKSFSITHLGVKTALDHSNAASLNCWRK